MKTKLSRQFLIFILFCLFFITVLMVSFLSTVLTFSQRGRMAYGLEFEGTPLTGMSREDAAELFKTAARQKMNGHQVLWLTFEQQRWQISPQQVGLTADIEATVEQAYAIGHSGQLLPDLYEDLRCALQGRSIKLQAYYDAPSLQDALQTIAGQINTPAANAACTFAPDGKIQKIPAVNGKSINPDSLLAECRSRLLAFSFSQPIRIHPETEAPAIGDEAIASIDSILASYTTYFYEGGNRGKNIHIAAEALDQKLIQPGEEFSFNNTVGGRIASAGYLDAPVIIDGKIEQDIGGGVCQVSSTLYDATLLAGLTPTARTAHFYPSAYVPAGLDATVADGQIDFGFRNDLPHLVCLLTRANHGALTIYVLGTKADLENQTIRLETKTEGPGPTVSAWRIYSQNGQEEQREHLHTDTYDTPPA